MGVYQLYIEHEASGEYRTLDILGESGLIIEANDPLSFDFGKSTKSYTITLLNNGNNNALLGNIFYRNADYTKIYENLFLNIDGLYIQGDFVLTKINARYAEGQFLSGAAQVWLRLGETTIPDLGWDEYNHTLDESITDLDKFGGDIIYDMANRGNFEGDLRARPMKSLNRHDNGKLYELSGTTTPSLLYIPKDRSIEEYKLYYQDITLLPQSGTFNNSYRVSNDYSDVYSNTIKTFEHVLWNLTPAVSEYSETHIHKNIVNNDICYRQPAMQLRKILEKIFDGYEIEQDVWPEDEYNAIYVPFTNKIDLYDRRVIQNIPKNFTYKEILDENGFVKRGFHTVNPIPGSGYITRWVNYDYQAGGLFDNNPFSEVVDPDVPPMVIIDKDNVESDIAVKIYGMLDFRNSFLFAPGGSVWQSNLYTIKVVETDENDQFVRNLYTRRITFPHIPGISLLEDRVKATFDTRIVNVPKGHGVRFGILLEMQYTGSFASTSQVVMALQSRNYTYNIKEDTGLPIGTLDTEADFIHRHESYLGVELYNGHGYGKEVKGSYCAPDLSVRDFMVQFLNTFNIEIYVSNDKVYLVNRDYYKPKVFNLSFDQKVVKDSFEIVNINDEPKNVTVEYTLDGKDNLYEDSNPPTFQDGTYNKTGKSIRDFVITAPTSYTKHLISQNVSRPQIDDYYDLITFFGPVQDVEGSFTRYKVLKDSTEELQGLSPFEEVRVYNYSTEFNLRFVYYNGPMITGVGDHYVPSTAPGGGAITWPYSTRTKAFSLISAWGNGNVLEIENPILQPRPTPVLEKITHRPYFFKCDIPHFSNEYFGGQKTMAFSDITRPAQGGGEVYRFPGQAWSTDGAFDFFVTGLPNPFPSGYTGNYDTKFKNIGDFIKELTTVEVELVFNNNDVSKMLNYTGYDLRALFFIENEGFRGLYQIVSILKKANNIYKARLFKREPEPGQLSLSQDFNADFSDDFTSAQPSFTGTTTTTTPEPTTTTTTTVAPTTTTTTTVAPTTTTTTTVAPTTTTTTTPEPVGSPFTFTVEIEDENTDVLRLHLDSISTLRGTPYDFTVDWGDGSSTESYSGVTASGTAYDHSYPEAGFYEVKIYGSCKTLRLRRASSTTLKVTDVKDWGSTPDFDGFLNIILGQSPILTGFTATNTPNFLEGSTSFSMFRGATSFNQDLSGWDTSNVTATMMMFYEATSFNQDLSGLDTSNVTSMAFMFYNAESFNQDLSGWDTSNVVTMLNMFRGATSFNGDLSGWDTGNVTSMSGMFWDATSFNHSGVTNWETSGVTIMGLMFYNAESFNQDLSSWNTSNVGSMSGMFRDASSFNHSGITNWDTSNVVTMSGMFRDASSFNQDLSDWDTSNVTNMGQMFYEASSFNQDLSGWCVTNITSEPSDFDTGATSWVLPRPVWGTCP